MPVRGQGGSDSVLNDTHSEIMKCERSQNGQGRVDMVNNENGRVRETIIQTTGRFSEEGYLDEGIHRVGRVQCGILNAAAPFH